MQKPLSHFITKMLQIIAEHKPSANRVSEYLNLRDLEDKYDYLRSLPVFESASQLKYEIEAIERVVNDMLMPIRAATTSAAACHGEVEGTIVGKPQWINVLVTILSNT